MNGRVSTMKRIEIPTELYDLVQAMAEECHRAERETLLLLLLNGLGYTSSVTHISEPLRRSILRYAETFKTDARREWHVTGLRVR